MNCVWYQSLYRACELHSDSIKAYKGAKRDFRAEKRRSVDEYESQNMKDIEINQDIDQNFFWFM